MKLRKIISRKTPPKAAIDGCASVTNCWYLSLSLSASSTASTGPILAVIATIRTGKTSRMPKTAISTPIVRKMVCQKALIRFRIPALITALSKDSETSRTARTATIPNATQPS